MSQSPRESWQETEGELFRLLVENVRDYAIFVADPQGRIRYWNPGAERLLGYQQEEILGQSLKIFFTPEDVQKGIPQQELRDALLQRRGNDDRWHVRKDGTRFWADGSTTPLRDPSGEVRGFAKIMRDRTQWKIREQEVEEQARLAAFSSDVSMALIQSATLPEMLQACADAMVQHLQVAIARIWTLDSGEHMLQLQATAGLDVQIDAADSQVPLGEGPIGAIAQERQPYLTQSPVGEACEGFPDSSQESVLRWEKKHGLVACAGYPLIVDQRVVGVTATFARQPLSAGATAALAATAHAITVGIERKVAQEKLRAAREDLERRVEERTAALSRGHEFMRALLENVQTGVVACDEAGVLTLFNGVARALYGLAEERLPAEDWADAYSLYHADGVTPMDMADIPLYRALRGERMVNTEMVIRPEGLPARTVQASGQAFYDAQGSRLGAVVSMQDITDRQESEDALRRAREELEQRVAQRTQELGHANAALRQSEDKWRLLVNTIPQLAWMARPDGHIFWYNQRWYEYTGTVPERVEGWGWQSVQDPEILPKVMQHWKASLASGEPFDMVIPIKAADQTYRPFLTRVNPLRDRDGRVLFWFGTNTDIAEQVWAKEALRQSERQHRFLSDVSAALVGSLHYQSILNQVADLAVPTLGDICFFDVFTDDLRLERVAWKHVDSALADWSEKLVGFLPSKDAQHDPVAKVIRSGKPEFVPAVTDSWLQQAAIRPEHLEFLRSLELTSLVTVPMSVGERCLGAVTFCYSVSGRHHTAEDLRLAEEITRRAALMVENVKLYEVLRDTDRRKDEFLATLAHELRNPLAPIRNSLEILKMPGIDWQTIQQSRNLMERQVHQLVRLVDDLLDVSRVMRGKIELRKEPVDLAQLVTRAVETTGPLIELQNHQLNVSLPTEPLLLDADPVRLCQVIGNLLTNSAKYTTANGQIWLTARRDGSDMVLSVRDNGIGIAREVLPHVFTLFVQVDHAATRSQGGLGIGLTLVKNLVEMHGGTVRAHSNGLGTGCEFLIRLPLLAQPSQPPQPSQPSQQGQDVQQAGAIALGHRLLVVDDNQDAANTLAMLLRLQGHEVRVAHDGPSALVLAASYRPNMVFLDIGMPGMDGYEVARRIRDTPGLTTVLTALTGWGQQEDRRRTAEAGFDHHLVKPPEPKAVELLLADLNRTNHR